MPYRSDDHIGLSYLEDVKNRIVAATEFKAKCLALLDEIEEHGGTITVTKRGRPVATIFPAKKPAWKSPAGILAGKLKVAGDIVNFDTSELWDALRLDKGSGFLKPRFLPDTHCPSPWLRLLTADQRIRVGSGSSDRVAQTV